MAFSNSINVQTQKLLVLVILLLATKAHSQETVSFNFTKFTAGDSSITLQGSASVTPAGVLSLTDHSEGAGPNVGRVLYSNPISIWDSESGEAFSFVSTFTFEIITYPGDPQADGLVFFLIDPTNPTIPENSGQGYLGVVDARNALNKFVGVRV
ncbi:putative bark agglutinin LECRPA3-like [Trifolium medium]|uniref:Putative bark agglutinin LECRPA3-like n=1 Tax=Trifolium medium TaxID=97028 RepID=A0A392M6G6_9FABA|nr:putative bark agglutinin LECRPA3-like [Trifolium medium]